MSYPQQLITIADYQKNLGSLRHLALILNSSILCQSQYHYYLNCLRSIYHYQSYHVSHCHCHSSSRNLSCHRLDDSNDLPLQASQDSDYYYPNIYVSYFSSYYLRSIGSDVAALYYQILPHLALYQTSLHYVLAYASGLEKIYYYLANNHFLWPIFEMCDCDDKLNYYYDLYFVNYRFYMYHQNISRRCSVRQNFQSLYHACFLLGLFCCLGQVRSQFCRD